MVSLAEQLQQSRLTILPGRLYEITQPERFLGLSLVDVNSHLLGQLGIDRQSFSCEDNFCEDNFPFLLNDQPSLDKPLDTPPRHLQAISTVYAGHQFGIYTSKLGDGRVHTLGDITARDGTPWEVQLKGAGATPFARGNNGRMSLAEAITEYLGCEAIAGLGIPGTRGLALINHSQPATYTQPQESIFVRTAPSHLRFGHFEYLHNQGDLSLLKALADHVIEYHYPELVVMETPSKYLQFLYAVTQRTARLLARWQSVGFVHSVMNTDNMSILGLTMDYGVYGFMEAYDPAYSPNDNDDQHRYAFDQQVDVARWNCLALAEALVELLPGKRIPAVLLRMYRQTYTESYLTLMRKKLGLCEMHAEDAALVSNLLALLQQHGIDYSRFFRGLSYEVHDREKNIAKCFNISDWQTTALNSWYERYQQRLRLETLSPQERQSMMLANNPKFMLRKSLLDNAIRQAEKMQNFTPLHELLLVLQSPFAEHESHVHLA